MKEFRPKNLVELEARLKEEWARIPSIQIQELIGSMPRRVAAVIEAKGGHTSYYIYTTF